jgi:hypothetical protein
LENREQRGELEELLKSEKKTLNCPALAWCHGAKDTMRYQLEVPEATARGLSWLAGASWSPRRAGGDIYSSISVYNCWRESVLSI